MKMREIRAWFLVVALAFNLVLFGALNVRAAHACSCVGTPLEKRLDELDAVFAGEVTNVEGHDLSPDYDNPDLGPGAFFGPVTFDVTETWKGDVPESVVVYGQGPESSCGLDFDKGKSYLVFAYRSDNGPGDHLETGLCEATKPLSDADENLRVLGSPANTLPDTGGAAASLLDRDTMGVVAVILVLLTLTAALAIRKGGHT